MDTGTLLGLVVAFTDDGAADSHRVGQRDLRGGGAPLMAANYTDTITNATPVFVAALAALPVRVPKWVTHKCGNLVLADTVCGPEGLTVTYANCHGCGTTVWGGW